MIDAPKTIIDESAIPPEDRALIVENAHMFTQEICASNAIRILNSIQNAIAFEEAEMALDTHTRRQRRICVGRIFHKV